MQFTDDQCTGELTALGEHSNSPLRFRATSRRVACVVSDPDSHVFRRQINAFVARGEH
jgi:hypothetical protein